MAPMPYNDNTFRDALAQLAGQQRPPSEAISFVVRSEPTEKRATRREVQIEDLVALLNNPDVSGLDYGPEGLAQPQNPAATASWGVETSLALIQVVERLQTAPIQDLLDHLLEFTKSLASAQEVLTEKRVDSLLDSEDSRIASIAGPASSEASEAKKATSPRAARRAATTVQDEIRALLDEYESIASRVISEAQGLDRCSVQLKHCLFVASAVAAAQEIADPTDVRFRLGRPIVSEVLKNLRKSVADIDRLLAGSSNL